MEFWTVPICSSFWRYLFILFYFIIFYLSIYLFFCIAKVIVKRNVFMTSKRRLCLRYSKRLETPCRKTIQIDRTKNYFPSQNFLFSAYSSLFPFFVNNFKHKEKKKKNYVKIETNVSVKIKSLRLKLKFWRKIQFFYLIENMKQLVETSVKQN